MIFYLSGTGNTLWAARTIGKALNEQLINVAACFQPNSSEKHSFTLQPNERIGFCFPVHGWRPPLLFRNFISKLNLQKAGTHYCWALCTAGDDIGQTMEYLNHDLAQISLQTESMFSLIMPESYVGLPFFVTDNLQKERAKKEQAAQQLNAILPIIANRQRGVVMTYKGQWPHVKSHIIGAVFAKWLITDRPFKVNASKCIGCSRCLSVCPTKNIGQNADKTPFWLHKEHCLTCFACYHHCPTHAIEYGKQTKNKGQYYFTKNQFV